MKSTTPAAAALGALLALLPASLAHPEADVDTRFPYTGPEVPVGDWVNPSPQGNGKGYPRLTEPPAVRPAHKNPTNNINVISLAYIPGGVTIHYQTPFGLGCAPSVHWGTSARDLCNVATGQTKTYERTPPCSILPVTQCSQFFHHVELRNLKPGTKYYYKISAANGTTESHTLHFKTAHAAGDSRPFTLGVLNDMGYTNALGTHKQMISAVDQGMAFAWHGGDISYADDWFSGILPCEDDWPVCYNGTSTRLPGPAPVPDQYKVPVPAGEVPSQGGPRGGDMSVLYESNWDLWQQWMNVISTRVPYMVLPGNHEAACAEFDGGNNTMTAYLNDNRSNSSAPKSQLDYYSCPPSQRNYTAFQNRFTMSGGLTKGRSNFWYSFDYGLAHFISLNGETDYANSPEKSFYYDLKPGQTVPTERNQTYVTNAGPFGRIDNGDYTNNKAYEQYQWLKADLEAVDRKKTPWVFINSHRPMYSSQVSGYQKNMRAAFEDLLLAHGVDAFFAGHIHWYERLFPLGVNGTIDKSSIVNNNTYMTNPGKSLTYITNGMAGNIESHSTLSAGKQPLDITAVLDYVHFGFSKLTVHNASVVTWEFVKGDGQGAGDNFTLRKRA